MDFIKLRAHYLLLLLVLLPMLAAKEDSIPPVLAPYFGTSLFFLNYLFILAILL